MANRVLSLRGAVETGAMSVESLGDRRRARRGFVALIAAEAISLSGNRITLLAIPWFVIATTGSATKAGLAAFAHFLPIVVGSFFGGAVVDRLGFVRSSVLADVASGVTVVAIPALHLAGMLSFWLLLVLSFAGALLDAPGRTARKALVPDLAAAAGIRLERATSSHESAVWIGQLAGGAVAGGLIVAVGAVGALFIDAGTFAVSVLAVGTFTAWATQSRPRGSTRSWRRYLGELREGLTFIRNDALLPSLLLIFLLANMADNALIAVLLPVYAEQVLGNPVALGLAVAAFGGGALAGTVAYSAIGHRLPRRSVLVVAVLVSGAPKFFVLTAGPAPWLLVVTMACAGLAAGPVNPLLAAVQFRRIPTGLRGRVLGAITSAVVAGIPLAVLGAGALAAAVGLSTTFLAIAVAYVLVSFIPVLHPAWRRGSIFNS